MKIVRLRDKFIHYLTKKEDLDRKLFKVLGLAGIIVSITAGIQSLSIGMLDGGIINLLAAICSASLLYFVDKTGRYFIGYILTVLSVFMGLFTVMFFEMGGMYGSMMSFFAFSLAFSFLMFKGWTLVVVEIVEIVYYTAVCYYSVKFPDSVQAFDTPADRFIDQIVGVMLSGIGIGLIFLFYIKEHRKQQKIAEEASEAKSRFLAQMSHEIRTPINMIMGMNELILLESDNDQITEYAAGAEEASRSLLGMVDKLLEYSHSEFFADDNITAVPADMTSARIMVVDDNNMNLSVVKYLLADTKVSVDTASSAEKCYELLKHNDYQLILMDYMMPVINGLEATEHIREEESKNGFHTPIIVLTADVTPGIRESFIQKGFDGYISKPVSFKDLEQCLTRYIPKNLVERRSAVSKANLTEEELTNYSTLLGKYDISLKEGLKYASGDFGLYVNVLRYFTNNAEPLGKQLDEAVHAGDLAGITTILHSLKGNAKNIGATELYDLCRKMEKHGRASDKEFVDSGIGLVQIEWQRACNGLIEGLSVFGSSVAVDNDDNAQDERSSKELLAELEKYLDSNEQIPAMKILDQLESKEQDEERKTFISRIRKYTGDIEFEKALELTRELMTGGNNGGHQDSVC